MILIRAALSAVFVLLLSSSISAQSKEAQKMYEKLELLSEDADIRALQSNLKQSIADGRNRGELTVQQLTGFARAQSQIDAMCRDYRSRESVTSRKSKILNRLKDLDRTVNSMRKPMAQRVFAGSTKAPQVQTEGQAEKTQSREWRAEDGFGNNKNSDTFATSSFPPAKPKPSNAPKKKGINYGAN